MVTAGVTEPIECPVLDATPDLVNVPIELTLDLALVALSLLDRLLCSCFLIADILDHCLLVLCG